MEEPYRKKNNNSNNNDSTKSNEHIIINVPVLPILPTPLRVHSKMVFLVMIHVRGMNLRIMDARNVWARASENKFIFRSVDPKGGGGNSSEFVLRNDCISVHVQFSRMHAAICESLQSVCDIVDAWWVNNSSVQFPILNAKKKVNLLFN